MGAVEVEPAEDLYQEVQSEKCVGEGGHFFERTGESVMSLSGKGRQFAVTCERCFISGFETPDEGER